MFSLLWFPGLRVSGGQPQQNVNPDKRIPVCFIRISVGSLLWNVVQPGLQWDSGAVGTLVISTLNPTRNCLACALHEASRGAPDIPGAGFRLCGLGFGSGIVS